MTEPKDRRYHVEPGRLAEIRKAIDLGLEFDDGVVKDLLDHIDALTARVAELEALQGDGCSAEGDRIVELSRWGR